MPKYAELEKFLGVVFSVLFTLRAEFSIQEEESQRRVASLLVEGGLEREPLGPVLFIPVYLLTDEPRPQTGIGPMFPSLMVAAYRCFYVVAVLGHKFRDIAKAKQPCHWDLPAYEGFIFYCLMSSRNRKGLDKFSVSGRERIVGTFAQKSPSGRFMDGC